MPASHRTWNPLQIPRTGLPRGGELADRRQHGREARDRPAAEVIAVGEPAGEDDSVDGRQLRLAVPDEFRLGAERLEGERRVSVVVRAGEDDDADAGAGLRRSGRHGRISIS